MPSRKPAFATNTTTIRLTTLLIIVQRWSPDLMEQPLPPCPGEEVRDDGPEALERGDEPFVQVVLPAGLVRPVDDQRLAFDVAARQEAPISAVLRIVAVVAHDEVLICRDRLGPEVLAHVVRRN